MFKRFFRKKSRSKPSQGDDGTEQAVLIYLNANDLPQEIYDQYDLATIEDRLRKLIQADNLGEYDGNEFGPAEVTLFMYGPDAEQLFSGIESKLRDYPLCQKARVVIRYGGPGASQRELVL